jgi:hypothetical protein
MAEYRIWGRIEKRPEGHFRAIASAIRDNAGMGPEANDVRMEVYDSLPETRMALGRLTYALSAALRQRGDQVVWIDVH